MQKLAEKDCVQWVYCESMYSFGADNIDPRSFATPGLSHNLGD